MRADDCDFGQAIIFLDALINRCCIECGVSKSSPDLAFMPSQEMFTAINFVPGKYKHGYRLKSRPNLELLQQLVTQDLGVVNVQDRQLYKIDKIMVRKTMCTKCKVGFAIVAERVFCELRTWEFVHNDAILYKLRLIHP